MVPYKLFREQLYLKKKRTFLQNKILLVYSQQLKMSLFYLLKDIVYRKKEVKIQKVGLSMIILKQAQNLQKRAYKAFKEYTIQTRNKKQKFQNMFKILKTKLSVKKRNIFQSMVLFSKYNYEILQIKRKKDQEEALKLEQQRQIKQKTEMLHKIEQQTLTPQSELVEAIELKSQLLEKQLQIYQINKEKLSQTICPDKEQLQEQNLILKKQIRTLLITINSLKAQVH